MAWTDRQSSKPFEVQGCPEAHRRFRWRSPGGAPTARPISTKARRAASRGILLETQLGPIKQGDDISSAHVASENGTSLAVSLVLVDAVADTQSMNSVVRVGVDTVGVQTREEFVHREACHERIQLNHSGPVFLYTSDVAFFKLCAVSGRICAEEPSRAHLFNRVNMSAEKAGTARL